MGGISQSEFSVMLLVCVLHADAVANDGAQLMRCGCSRSNTHIQGSTNTYLD